MTLVARVKGRVQGVGFRLFAVDAARRLHLRGYARNLPDGSLEVLACGDRGRLKLLLDLLNEGPTMALVTSVEQEWSDDEPAGVGSSFEVRR